MICYTTLDGFVIERVFRGNCATAETCRKRLASARPEAHIRCAPDVIKSKTLYDACCKFKSTIGKVVSRLVSYQ